MSQQCRVPLSSATEGRSELWSVPFETPRSFLASELEEEFFSRETPANQ